MALAFPELRALFGGAAYVPDVSVYRWARIPRTADGEVANVFDTPPDVAIEIVSSEQSTNALVRRCVWYVDNAVAVALLVDPADRSIVRFERGRAPRILRDHDRIDFGAVLPELTVAVADLFGSLRLDG